MTKSLMIYRLSVPLVLIMFWTGLNMYIMSIMTNFEGPIGSKLIHITLNITDALFYLSFSWFIIRFTNIFVFEYFMEKRLSITTPKLLKDVYNILVFIGSIITILNRIFEIPLTGLLAATSAVGVVLGFALRDVLADLFSRDRIKYRTAF